MVGDRAYRGLTRLAARKGLALDVKAPPAGANGFTSIWPLYKDRARVRPAGPVAPPVALLRG